MCVQSNRLFPMAVSLEQLQLKVKDVQLAVIYRDTHPGDLLAAVAVEQLLGEFVIGVSRLATESAEARHAAATCRVGVVNDIIRAGIVRDAMQQTQGDMQPWPAGLTPD